MAHVEIILRFPLSTAFHTAGNRRRIGVDKALALDAEGNPVVPATTIKGFLRDRAETLLRTWGQRVCLSPAPETMCSEEELCLVCQVFGTPCRPSPLRFQDGHFVQNPDTVVRSGVGISRSRRAALPQHLFFLETTDPQPGEVVVKIEGDFSDVNLAQQAIALVALAARFGFALGAGSSRGLGWLATRQIRWKASIDGLPVEPTLLEQYIHLWGGEKDVAGNQA